MEAPREAAGLPLVEGRTARPRTRRPLRLRVYLWGIGIGVAGGLLASAMAVPQVREQLASGFPWIVALFIAEMFPVPVWRDIHVSLGFPMLMFIAVLYEPAAVGVFALIGSGDPREFNGRSDLLRSIFNRSQVAAAGLTASLVFHGLAPSAGVGAVSVGAALVAGIAQVSVNMLLVGIAARLDYGISLRNVMRRMPIGGQWRFQSAYLAVGVAGAVTALVYLEVGAWAVAGLVLPLVAMRYLVLAAGRLARSEAELRRDIALKQVSDQMTADRHREQERLATVLHDEISPLLSSLSLVLDVTSRQVGDTKPELVEQLRVSLEEARDAQAQVRRVIGQLIRPEAAGAGFRGALRKLLDELKEDHSIAVREDVEQIEAPTTINDLLFGVAREATRNAVQHGSPRRLEVVLREDDGSAVLTVSDDGSGFDPDSTIPLEERYGLRLLRQRVETCGGQLSIVSSPGSGTSVTAQIPLGPRAD